MKFLNNALKVIKLMILLAVLVGIIALIRYIT